ncbi:MAG: ABC transporter permease [Gemmatimonadota bacterium]
MPDGPSGTKPSPSQRNERPTLHSRSGPVLLALALIPGLGHLLLGRRRRGLHLLLFTGGMLSILALRWETFVEVFSSPAIDEWLASRFLLAAVAGGVLFSVLDVRRLVGSGEGEEPAASTSEISRGLSPFRMALHRFSANGLAVAAAYVIVSFYLVALLAPILAPYDPTAIENVLDTRYLSPSPAHLFGTDEFGRDLFSRAVYGARVSLAVGLLAVLIAVSFGTVYGAVAGYVGGVVDNLLMRLVDVIIAFPTFFLMLMLVGVFEANVVFLVLILGFTSWTGTARFIRGEILSLKERDFIESARVIGLPSHLIIMRHLIPNAMAPVLVSAALMVGGMIAAEAGLSFLGIGIRPPTPSWGNMISAGQDALLVAWWVALFPGLLLAATILCFNLLADGLRDALDPKTLMRKYV